MSKIVLELTPLEANALLRLIAEANRHTLDTEPKDRLAGTWVANRLVSILSAREPARPKGSKRERLQRTLDSLGGRR